ncbi:MAG: TraK family protein, partial [Shewanella sp.]|uniref:TraK family protein n=1 Tax=Shewanella sp. TaxID=50422 RepID=UPI003F38C7FE
AVQKMAGTNRAAFLAVMAEVKQALDDGWSAHLIWETLCDEKKVACSYATFNRYIKRLIDHAAPPQASLLIAGQSQPTTNPSAENITVDQDASPSSAISGFNFNPTPNKKDLL